MKLKKLFETVGHWQKVYGHPGWPKDSKYSKPKKKGKSIARRQNLSFLIDDEEDEEPEGGEDELAGAEGEVAGGELSAGVLPSKGMEIRQIK